MNCLCVIPARGGSKRLPGKNTAPVHGRPVILQPIEVAHATGLFSGVIVSTDSAKVAEAVRGMAVVEWRKKELCEDQVTDIEVVQDIASRYPTADYLLYHYPTAALTTARQIVEGLSILRASGALRTRCVLTWVTDGPDAPWHDAGSFYWYNLTKVRRADPLTEAFQVVPHLHAQDIDDRDDLDMLRAKMRML